MRRSLPLLLTVLAALPASASAATPLQIGAGRDAHVAVDSLGTGFIAWNGTTQSPPLYFCRLPRNAGLCDVSTLFNLPGGSLTRPFVTVTGSTVRIFTYRYALASHTPGYATYVLTSTDRGQTFDSGREAGVVGTFDAISGPGGNVSVIENNSATFQTFPADPSSRTNETAALGSGSEYLYSPTIALTGASSLLAVATTGSSAAAFRRWTGTGSANLLGNWTAWQPFASYAAYPRLATGPSGTFVASDNAAGNLEVRRFASDGSGFGDPVAIPGSAKEASGGAYDLSQDPSGRLHLIWPQSDANGMHVGYASSDDGVTWRTTVFDVADPKNLSRVPYAMRMALASDHLGFAVWDNGGGQDGAVHAMAVGPEVPAPVATATATPTATAAASATATPVATATPPAPDLGSSAVVAPVSGTVRIKTPGASGYTTLTGASEIPMGSLVDTKAGSVQLTSAVNLAGATQTAVFHSGVFKPAQKRADNAVTELVLAGGSFKRCPKAKKKRKARRSTAVASKARTVRRLWGDGKGKFRTRGKHAAGTVRGTVWLTEDRCDGTWLRVKSGSIIVQDLARKKRYTLKAPKTRHVAPR